MSEFLTKNNFYQIRDVLPKVKVGIIDYNATRKINGRPVGKPPVMVS